MMIINTYITFYPATPVDFLSSVPELSTYCTRQKLKVIKYRKENQGAVRFLSLTVLKCTLENCSVYIKGQPK